MKRFFFLVLGLTVSPTAAALSLDCIMLDSFQNAVPVPANWAPLLTRHNCARRSVTPAASPRLNLLSWDTTIAASAQAYANNCQYVHNAATPYGENLYAGAVSPGFPTNVEAAAATDWANEHASYNYAANSCSGICGHYTQMVWRSTTRVGCGIRQCTVNSPFPPPFTNWTLVVCNYDPAGNVIGQRPY
ncbi:MAG TPA: CAP domain-containing protein [Tahibacter sp.]|uniref:CAP domain-containing protein n=1 Tax=Tahibacter sp. TaxID=2056211 RepID=UPI002C276487|nr:CAP domain-containing protein [Tahibacter sp.]HSX61222.1 CAP domain-containing protein [Tahibacter sp.]